MGGEVLKDENQIKGNMRFLLKEVWQRERLLYLFFLLNILLTLIFSLSSILAPRFLIQELTGSKEILRIVLIVSIYFIVFSASGFFLDHIRNYWIMCIMRIRYDLMAVTKEKVMRAEFKTLEDPKYLNGFWNVLTATGDVFWGVQGILTRSFSFGANLIASVFYLGILSSLSPLLVAFLAINILLVYLAQRWASAYNTKRSQERAAYERREQYFSRTMGNHRFGKDIRVYGLSNFIIDKMHENNVYKRDINIDIEAKGYRADLVETIMSCLRDVAVYGYLIVAVMDGGISIADFSMFFLTVATLTIALQTAFRDVATIKGELFRIAAMRDFLENADEGQAEENTLDIPEAAEYEIEFKDVSFKYPNTEKYIYEHFNFKIEAGKKLAIVGVNGAGKTTLVKLLSRLYKPTAGQILLNGIDIERFKLSEYRDLITAVFQEVNIFAMTLQENVALTDGHCDEKRIYSALDGAGFGEKLATMEKGIKTQLTKYLHDDGVDLSGGEKQKLAIARALYKGGQIMIFDEPTAALDAHAEYKLYTDLAEISRGKTLLFISHRLATTRFCDSLALLDGGRVAEYGTHEELMGKQGLYYHMFMTQKKYYEEEKGEKEAGADA